MRDSIIDYLRAAFVLPMFYITGRNRVRILLYHKICDLPPGKYQFHAIPPDLFDRQMQYLHRNKYNVITLRQFAEYKEKNIPPPRQTVIITFDDGYMENYLNAFPILQKYGFKATFFIVTDYIDSKQPYQWLDWDKELMSQFTEKEEDWLPLTSEMILRMRADGHEIGAHTNSHPRLSQIGEEDAFKEIRGSKEHLEQLIAEPVLSFSYPYGDFNEKTKNLVEAAGYKIAVATSGPGSTLKSDFRILGRVAVERFESRLRFQNKLKGAYDWDSYWQFLIPKK